MLRLGLFTAGIPYTAELKSRSWQTLPNPMFKGLTLLGGEPFLNTAFSCL